MKASSLTLLRLLATSATPQPTQLDVLTRVVLVLSPSPPLTIFAAAAIAFARTGWSHTDALLMRLVWITMETQLLPTILSIVCAIDFAPNYSLAVATP